MAWPSDSRSHTRTVSSQLPDSSHSGLRRDVAAHRTGGHRLPDLRRPRRGGWAWSQRAGLVVVGQPTGGAQPRHQVVGDLPRPAGLAPQLTPARPVPGALPVAAHVGRGRPPGAGEIVDSGRAGLLQLPQVRKISLLRGIDDVRTYLIEYQERLFSLYEAPS